MTTEQAETPANRVVLLVEDNSDVRSMLSRGLRRAQIDVIEVENAQDARDVLQARPVDALVTDLSLPGRASGAELGSWARFRFPTLPTLFITGLSEPDFPQDLVIDDFSGFLCKPFGIRLLVERVRSMMSQDPEMLAAD